MLDGLDAEVGRAFELTLSILASAGAQVDTFDLPELGELAELQQAATFPAVEAWAWHRQRLASRERDYDPRVAQRIQRGAAASAADYIDLIHARCAWSARVAERLRGYDAALSPTVPMVAPAMAPLLSSDQRFFAINTLLLRNPSVVNMLDGCALSLPCQEPGQMPVGLMVWAPALHDEPVLTASLAIERALAAASAGRH
jgi:amidase/aspartyl-tRNA(Asn)/glutamyl-tRNA(Gln) amidotransferase subunit A